MSNDGQSAETQFALLKVCAEAILSDTLVRFDSVDMGGVCQCWPRGTHLKIEGGFRAPTRRGTEPSSTNVLQAFLFTGKHMSCSTEAAHHSALP